MKDKIIGDYQCNFHAFSSRFCESVSAPISLVSTSNVMLLSFRLTQGRKIFRGFFQALMEESESFDWSICIFVSGDTEPLLSFPYRVYKYDSVTCWPRWCWSYNQSILSQSVTPSVLLLLDVSGTAPNRKRFLMCRNIIHSIRVTERCFLLAVDVSDAQRSSGRSSQVPELHA